MHIDKAGNVIGTRAGAAAHPNLVLAAHLDTVFPEGTDVKVTRDGTVLKGPGIGDDCRGLAVMLGVIQALKDGRVQTPGTITFVADVGEEGLGDLRGTKNLFNDSLKARSISLSRWTSSCEPLPRCFVCTVRATRRGGPRHRIETRTMPLCLLFAWVSSIHQVSYGAGIVTELLA